MTSQDFSEAAKRVVRRCTLLQWSAMLGYSGLATFGTLLVAIGLWSALGGAWPGLLLGVSCVLVWLAGAGAWAWYIRPADARALAIWDERPGRNEMFVSAYCFQQSSARTAGEEVHLARAQRALASELPQLPQQLPLHWQHRVWLAPLVFIVLLQAIGYLRQPAEAAIGREGIDTAAQQRAAEVAAQLVEKTQSLEPLPGLDDAERKEVEKLKQSVQEVAENMKHLEQATPREALGELEQRARAAESLAETLGEADATKLSAEMLAEMEHHADTADLAGALQADDADKVAAEANKLAEKLADKKTSLEERQRINEALKKSLEAANSKDRQSAVGKHLQETQKHLQEKKSNLASKRLRDLARSMSRRAERSRSARQLQQMARNLRSAGQQIFGRQNSGIQKLAQQQNSGQAGSAPRVSSARQISLAQLMAGQPQGAQSASGAQQPAQQSGQQGAMGFQPAGAGGNQPAGQHIAAGGQQPGGQNGQQLAMAVPVPGSGNRPGGSSPAGGAQPGAGGAIPIPGTGSGQGQMPGAGSSGSSAGAGGAAGGSPGGGGASSAGGLQAGTGTAAMGNSPTQKLTAQKQGNVKVNPSGEGPSQVREFDATPRAEATERNARQLAVDFIKVEEEALADEPLPVSRREQVRRYFNSLRQQLSEPPAKTEPKHDD